MAARMVERRLVEGIERNFEAAEIASDALGWPWLINALETARLARTFRQSQRPPSVDLSDLATLPPSTVPSQSASKATTEAEVSVAPLRTVPPG